MNLKAGSLRKTDKTDKPVGRPMRKKERRHKLSISGTEEVTLVWILQILKREKEPGKIISQNSQPKQIKLWKSPYSREPDQSLPH